MEADTKKPTKHVMADRTEYHLDGNIHNNEGEPAVIFADGTSQYWRYGKMHCLSGPAHRGSDGTDIYFIDGVEIHKHVYPMAAKNYLKRRAMKETYKGGPFPSPFEELGLGEMLTPEQPTSPSKARGGSLPPDPPRTPSTGRGGSFRVGPNFYTERITARRQQTEVDSSASGNAPVKGTPPTDDSTAYLEPSIPEARHIARVYQLASLLVGMKQDAWYYDELHDESDGVDNEPELTFEGMLKILGPTAEKVVPDIEKACRDNEPSL